MTTSTAIINTAIVNTLAAFETRYPLATRFFTHVLENHQLAHAYILKGQNQHDMVAFALKIAKIINCESRDKSQNAVTACGECQPCRWIENNSHPEVRTISRLLYPTEESPEEGPLAQELSRKSRRGSTSTVIAKTKVLVEQMNRLIQELAYTAHGASRVVIFVDIDEITYPEGVTEAEQALFASSNQLFQCPVPYEWLLRLKGSKKRLTLRPVTEAVLDGVATNRILKTLEEPPAGTLFFFITDDESQLIETIVSRCQMIPFPLTRETTQSETTQGNFDRELSQKVLQWVQETENNPDCFASAQRFSTLFQGPEPGPTSGLTLMQILVLMQQVLRQEAVEILPSDIQFFRRNKFRQSAIQDALSSIQASVTPENTVLQLVMQLQG